MTNYRKLLWLDGDDFIVRNIDHLLMLPTL
jgi:alpha-N-acetylglucosamine transferase